MRDEIRFDDDEHRYFYQGREISGITSLVGKRLGKVFPSCMAEVPHIQNARVFGTIMHEDVEMFVKKGRYPFHPVSHFVCEEFARLCPKGKYNWASELLVSDYKNNATAIDLVGIAGDKAITFDIKTGNFNRDYCSWQLGIGNYFLEMDGDLKVEASYVISTKDKYTYKILPKSRERVEALLYGE